MTFSSAARRPTVWCALLGTAAALSAWASAAPGQIILPGPDPQIRRVVLDDQVTQWVPTFSKTTTSVLFPYAIEDVSGVGFSKDPSKTRGDFYVKVEPRSPKLDVVPIDDPRIRTSPLVAGEGRNVNVMSGGKVYVLKFFLAEDQGEAVTKVVFVRPEDLLAARRPKPAAPDDPGGPSPSPSPLPVTRSLTPPASPFEPAGDARIMGVLDALKLVSGTTGEVRRKLLEQMPHLMLSDRTEGHAGSAARRAQDTTAYDGFEVRLERVIRNNRIDALGFEVVVLNKTRRTLQFDPESFGVRVGENVYPQVTSDFNPVLAPQAEARAWFAIITSPSGSPNYLSPDNPFSVLLSEADRPRAEAAPPRHPGTQLEGKGTVH